MSTDARVEVDESVVLRLPTEWIAVRPSRLRAAQVAGLERVQRGLSFVHVSATGSGKLSIAAIPALCDCVRAVEAGAALEALDVLVVPTIVLGLDHERAINDLVGDSTSVSLRRVWPRALFVLRRGEGDLSKLPAERVLGVDDAWVVLGKSVTPDQPKPEGVAVPTCLPCSSTPGARACDYCRTDDVRGVRRRKGVEGCTWSCRCTVDSNRGSTPAARGGAGRLRRGLRWAARW